MKKNTSRAAKPKPARVRLVPSSVEQAHPAEEQLEKYALGSLAGSALARMEEHLIICASCRSRVRSLDEFTTVVRRAAIELATSPLDFTHETDSGPVHLFVQPADGGGWQASITSVEPFETVAEANEFLNRIISRAYPKHKCSACHAGQPEPR